MSRLSLRRKTRQTSPVRGTSEIDRSMFRRNRTLPGEYTPQGSKSSSGRHHVHMLRLRRRTIVVMLALCAVGVAAIIWIMDECIVTPTIVVDVTSPKSIQIDQFRRDIDGYFGSNPIERFGFARSVRRIESTLQYYHPEVASVTIDNTSGLFAHTITIQLRTPLARWQLGDKTYFVDAEGVMFADASAEVPGLIVRDESGLPLEAQRVASQALLKSIGQIVGQVRSQGVGTVTEVILPRGTLRQVDITLRDRPYRILLNIDRDAAQQVGDIGNALRYIDAQRITPLYVDVRVEGKAFYRD